MNSRRYFILAFLLFSPAVIGAAPAAEVIHDRFATVDGVKLHYLQAGSGTESPIVLLHGYAQTSHMWRPLMPKLAARHVVIAPDLRGAGGSDKPMTGYEKKSLAREVHALVQSLGFPSVRIVGHDIGLMVAYAYAAQSDPLMPPFHRQRTRTNFRTIKISQAKSGWKGLRTLESYEVASALVLRPLAIGLVVT